MEELERLAEAVAACWSRWTVDQAESAPWSRENPSAGHCHITALVLHDRIGGELLEARVERADGGDGGWHYWNRLPDGRELDLTRDQFRSGQRIGSPRSIPPPADRTRGRVAGQYWLLRGAVERRLGGEEPTDAVPVSIKAVCRDAAGRLLVCRNHRGEWELPGGRPEFGESFPAALTREVAQETGLAVTAGRVLGVDTLLTPGGWVAIVAYDCQLAPPSAEGGDAGSPGALEDGGSRADPVPSDEHTAVAFLGETALEAAALPGTYRRLAALA